MSKRYEEYLEVIHEIVEKKGYARAKDLANALHVSPSTVTEMIQKLDREGYVNYEKYGGMTLTPKGKKLVEDLARKHEVLKNFFILIGVEEEVAEQDACKIEHIASDGTTEALTKFVEFVQKHDNPRWIERFRIYQERGELVECPKTKKGNKK
ncbi:MAG: MarR family transcriptional regulator [Thermoplasmata archaeon]|jgi:DtxR family Mn-dependent transcriptional regulator|nr:MarR family transcriptional regulator [Thermoplasmata archaeon]